MEMVEPLDALNDRFQKHWETVYKDHTTYMTLLVRLLQVEESSMGTFLEDYLSIPREFPDDFALDAARVIRKHRSG